MKLFPICPPDFLLISATTIVLLAVQLILILLSSSDSLSSLPEVLSLIVFLILLRDLKAFVAKLIELHLISVG